MLFGKETFQSSRKLKPFHILIVSFDLFRNKILQIMIWLRFEEAGQNGARTGSFTVAAFHISFVNTCKLILRNTEWILMRNGQ